MWAPSVKLIDSQQWFSSKKINHCSTSCHFLQTTPEIFSPHPSSSAGSHFSPLSHSVFKSLSFLFTPHSSLQCSFSLPLSLAPSALPSSQHLINICLGFHSLSACRHLHTCELTEALAFTQPRKPCLRFKSVKDKNGSRFSQSSF